MIEDGPFSDAAVADGEMSRANDPQNVKATGGETALRRVTPT
jgi:hypothetical protein